MRLLIDRLRAHKPYNLHRGRMWLFDDASPKVLHGTGRALGDQSCGHRRDWSRFIRKRNVREDQYSTIPHDEDQVGLTVPGALLLPQEKTSSHCHLLNQRSLEESGLACGCTSLALVLDQESNMRFCSPQIAADSDGARWSQIAMIRSFESVLNKTDQNPVNSRPTMLA